MSLARHDGKDPHRHLGPRATTCCRPSRRTSDPKPSCAYSVQAPILLRLAHITARQCLQRIATETAFHKTLYMPSRLTTSEVSCRELLLLLAEKTVNEHDLFGLNRGAQPQSKSSQCPSRTVPSQACQGPPCSWTKRPVPSALSSTLPSSQGSGQRALQL